MAQQPRTMETMQRAGRLAALLLASAALALLLSPARAQEALVRIQIDAPEEPVPAGEEFEAQVLVEDVEHLAGFGFTIEYDPKRVSPVSEEGEEGTPPATPGEGLGPGDRPVRILDVGAFLTESERREGLICGRPVASEGDEDGARGTVAVSCVTTGPPVCLGGLPGVSGSGLLARVVFEAKGGGSTTLKLTDTTLVFDDILGCDVENRSAESIGHSR